MYNLRMKGDDIVFNSNMELETISDNDEVAQSIERTLTTRLGEFFLDVEIGMDYSELQEKNYNEDVIIDNIRTAIFQDSRVDSIEDITLDIDPKARQIQVKFDIIVSNTVLTGEVTV